MALIKTIEMDTGEEATYHHIRNVNWDKTAKSASVNVAGFISFEKRQEGKLPCTAKNYTLEFTYLPTMADAYDALKELEEWTDAEDT